MGQKRTQLFAAYVLGASALVATWLSCNTEADRLARAQAAVAAAAMCAPYIERPDYYAECVTFFTDEFYPSFRATLTWLVVAYTGALIGLLAGAGVFFGF